MGVFKEIPKADGSGITTFYRLDNDKDTVETTSTGGTETMIDYNKALNKPSINNVVLVGNKTLDELGIQPKGDYITEIPSEYITEEELNQKQYATESYVLDKIANIEHFSRQVVDELPLVGKDNVIYLVRKEGAGDDIYNEYIWTGTSYELFGSTATDLSDYYNKDSVNELLDTKVDKQEGKGLSSNDYTNADKSKLASLENYDDSELRAAIDSLHNYDDTEIRQEINKLSNESEAMSEKIEDIDKTNDYKLEAVRLIKSGDYWIWKDSADNLIDYFKARDLLGTENCILIMEQLDSDGKSIPADYKIDGDRIRILYKDLENLNHEMYMGPPDKNTKTGNYIEIDNAAEASINNVKIYGETYQYKTTGKNLYNAIPISKNGMTVSANERGILTINGTATTSYANVTKIFKVNFPTDTYTFSIDRQVNFPIRFKIKYEDDSLTDIEIPAGTTSITKTLSKGIKEVYVFVFGLSVGTKVNNLTFGAQIEQGEESTDYEPYTGAKPSPNPDYPQQINNVKGYRNLFDVPYNTKTGNGMTLTYQDNKIILNGTTTALTNFWSNDFSILLPKGTYTLSSNVNLQGKGAYALKDSVGNIVQSNLSTPVTFTLTEDKIANLFLIQINEGVTFENQEFQIQLIEGSETKPFVPFGNNCIQINSNGKNLFNIDTLLDNEITMTRGTIEKDVNSKSITLKSTGNDCYISNTYHMSKEPTQPQINGVNKYGIPVLPNTKYTWSFEITNLTGTGSQYMFFYDENYVFLYLKSIGVNKNGRTNITVETEQNVKYVCFRFGLDKAQYTLTVSNVQFEKGDNVTEYHSYQSNSIYMWLKDNELAQNDFVQVANNYGTIYKTKETLELTGDENWKSSQNNRFYCQDFSTNIKFSSKILSTHFKSSTTWVDNSIFVSSSGNVGITIPTIQTVEEFKQWLKDQKTNGTPVIVQYELQNNQNISLGNQNSLPLFENYNYITNSQNLNMELTYSTNTNYNENIILGNDSYYYGIVDNKQSLPEGKAKGTLCQTKDTKDFYIYNGEEWIPVDKTASFDLSNYLSKDNTTPYSPSDRYNPATKQYVDTNIQGLKIPTKVSQLENDSNYITENTNTLVNYYNKNNTYNKKEVDALIDSSGLTPVSVTLNGQKTTDANFYAPTSGGTANQILISQGDAAPVWQNNTAVQTVNQDIKLVISDTRPEAPSSGFILWVDSTK